MSASAAYAGPREEGYRLYRHGEYRAALKQFTSAYRQQRKPALLYNVAKCHEKLAEYEEAIRYFKEYLSKVPDAPDRKDAEQIIASLRLRLKVSYPEVEFVSSPPGANVRIDKEFVGQAPFKMQLKPGGYEVLFELKGYQDTHRTLRVEPAKPLRIAVLLSRQRSGSLKVLSNVEGARILLDGELVGLTPQAKAQAVNVGQHRIVIEKEGFLRWEQQVTVAADRERTVFADLAAIKRSWSRKAVIGTILLGLAAVSEGMAWYFYAQGNEQYQGTADFERSRGLTIGLHVGAGVLAAAGLGLLTWWLLEPKEQLTTSSSMAGGPPLGVTW